ncbi:unnamed protein product [Durusdinium trenchii]|uniref:Uncharacterized protein n=3 Tax=Durusdinium trenchii TaxID=1381693 RepID=A0ABP0K7I6_9DINO
MAMIRGIAVSLAAGCAIYFIVLLHFPLSQCRFPSCLHQERSNLKRAVTESDEVSIPAWRLPKPPRFDRGIYQLGAGEYMNVSKFHGLMPAGIWKRLVPLLHKLAKGNAINIVVFGGSFTAGAGCHQPDAANDSQSFKNKLCSWTARFLHWLRVAFPQSTVELENRGHGGSPSAVILGGVGLFNYSTVDLILVDTLVNDATDENRAFGKLTNDADVNNLSNMELGSVAFEVLIRTLSELAPKSTIYGIEAGCPLCLHSALAHRVVLDFYGVPYLDFAKLVEKDGKLWTPKKPHPTFKTHQAVADVLAFTWSNVWDRMYHIKSSEVNEVNSKAQQMLCHPQSTFYHPALYRNRFTVCKKPCAILSPWRRSTVEVRIIRGNWSFYEDRPGKPGWISTCPGSVMEIPLCFGQSPTFSLTYLRSYEKMGKAKVTLNGISLTINGLWDDGNRFAQSETLFAQAGNGLLQTWGAGILGFNVTPNSSLPLRRLNLESGNNKMKIIEIISC